MLHAGDEILRPKDVFARSRRDLDQVLRRSESVKLEL